MLVGIVWLRNEMPFGLIKCTGQGGQCLVSFSQKFLISYSYYVGIILCFYCGSKNLHPINTYLFWLSLLLCLTTLNPSFSPVALFFHLSLSTSTTSSDFSLKFQLFGTHIHSVSFSTVIDFHLTYHQHSTRWHSLSRATNSTLPSTATPTRINYSFCQSKLNSCKHSNNRFPRVWKDQT